jgi:hypothetical protein
MPSGLRTLLVSLIVTVCFASSASAMTIAERSATDCCIVIGSNASAPEKTAAAELQQYLKQVTGADFAIKTESQAKASAPRILVGQSREVKRLLPDVDWAALGHDGIVIRTVGKDLVLAGGEPRGTLYAVYTFLEDTVGVRWWTGTESFVPTKRTLVIPDLNTNYTPKLRYREAYYRDPNENPLFAAKLKLDGHHYDIPREYGGHYNILGWCHTAFKLLPPEQYFAQHPDWYSEINGKRTASGAQLCFTNDEMRKELTRVALEWIAKNPSAGIISISQNDCYNPCQCPKCKAVEAEEGSPSGPLIRFVNAVAADIEKQYPDMLVETLAYQYTRKPPLHVQPRKNVIIRLCSIECDFSKPLDSDANKSFRDDMLGWKAIAPNLFIWDYVTDFAAYLQPHPNMRVLAPNLRFFVANNTIGVFEQGDAGSSIGDFVRLRAWLLAHLEWDPTADEKALTTEFLNGYYGPAGPYIQHYLDLMHDSVEQTGQRLGCYNGDLRFLSLPVMNQAAELFAKADKAVAHDPVLAARVRRDRMPLDFAWLMKYDALKQEAESANATFAGPKDPAKAAREFIQLAREWKAGQNREGRPFDSYVPELEAKFGPPPPMPKELDKLPKQDVIDIQESEFQLAGVPEWVDAVKDPAASNGVAARMPGDHTQWAVQYHITADVAKKLNGSYKCYAIIRCDTGDRGGSFRLGLYRTSAGDVAVFTPNVSKSVSGTYRTYYLGAHKLTAGEYFYVAPPGDANSMKAVYVDRLVLVRDR